MHDDDALDRRPCRSGRRPTTGPPDSFMYERGLASTTGTPASRPSSDVGAAAVRLEPRARAARRAGRPRGSRRCAGWPRTSARDCPGRRPVAGRRPSAARDSAVAAGLARPTPRPATAAAASPSACSASGASSTMPSSSAASATSASSSACGRRLGDDRPRAVSGSVTSVEPAGSSTSAGRDLAADREALDARPRSSVGRWVASASTLIVVFSTLSRPPGTTSPTMCDRDVDGDLLAAAHGQQVDVLEVALDRVALDRLRDGELLAALDVEGQQHVGAAVPDGVGELAGRQGDVTRVGAVAVDDGRHLAGPAGAAGAALAELGARLGGQSDLGHSGTPRFSISASASAVPYGASDGRGTRVDERHRVDHGFRCVRRSLAGHLATATGSRGLR